MFVQALILQTLLQNARERDTWTINLVTSGMMSRIKSWALRK